MSVIIKGPVMPVHTADQFAHDASAIPHTDFDIMQKLQDDTLAMCRKKDAEYGASWCKRGGVGAFFTIWRKADRLEEQLRMRGFNMLDVTDDPNSTESLDETIRDFANYLYLVLEKRKAARLVGPAVRGTYSNPFVKDMPAGDVPGHQGAGDQIGSLDPAWVNPFGGQMQAVVGKGSVVTFPAITLPGTVPNIIQPSTTNLKATEIMERAQKAGIDITPEEALAQARIHNRG